MARPQRQSHHSSERASERSARGRAPTTPRAEVWLRVSARKSARWNEQMRTRTVLRCKRRRSKATCGSKIRHVTNSRSH
eukprot:1770198-Rhodomonas_salina.3